MSLTPLKSLIKKTFGARTRKSLQEMYPQHRIGRYSYGDVRVQRHRDGASLTIGAFCSIGAGVKILLGGEHRHDWVTTYPFNILWDKGKGISGHPRSKGDVIIGNDVWIGTETLILSGVNIGDGAVIGARSVVVDDIPPYAIAAGNPARIVKRRFSEPIIERLLTLKWWEWDDKKIEAAIPLLLSDEIETFLDAFELPACR